MKNNYLIFGLLIVLTFFEGKAQEVIAVINEPNIVLLNPFDGSIINPSFIDLTPLNQGQPKGIAQVGSEIWISDQTADRIDRFDLTGAFTSAINTGLDNVKGLNVIGDEVWVTNAGNNNGAPGAAIIRYDFQGNLLGNFSTVGPTVSSTRWSRISRARMGRDTSPIS